MQILCLVVMPNCVILMFFCCDWRINDDITPVLRKLRWLPIRRRVEFQLACLVHHTLAGQTPAYLTCDIHLTAETGCPQLRTASERIMCRSTQTHNSFGDTSFSAAGRSSCMERIAIISVAGHEL